MRNVVFVAPIFMPATIRFIHAVARLDGIKLGLIASQSLHRLDPAVQKQIHHSVQVANCLDPGQLYLACQKLIQRMGSIDRLFGALEELQEPIARLRDLYEIEGLGQVAARRFRDKSAMKSALRAGDIPCAHHCLAENPTAALNFAEECGFPLIVKPPAGAGAKHTFRIENMDQLRQYLKAYDPRPNSPALFEEFIQGDEYSFEAVTIRGKTVWHSLTRYYPNPLEVLKNPWIQWCVLLPREVDSPAFADIAKVNQAALKTLGMHTGISHMEWFRRQDGSIAVSEIGARPPGAQIMTLMSYAHDKNFYHAWAELMVFDHFDPPKRHYATGAAYLRGQGQGKVKAIHGLTQAQQEIGEVVVETKLPRMGQPASTSYEGDGYVIVRHPDTAIVKQALQRLVSLIRIEYV